MSVRNYRGADVEFVMPVAYIHDAKALAAEHVITTPMTAADRTLFADLERPEFRGRPVEASYSLIIPQTEVLDFDAIEDVQLVLYYRYWSASDTSKSAGPGGDSEGEE